MRSVAILQRNRYDLEEGEGEPRELSSTADTLPELEDWLLSVTTYAALVKAAR